MFSDISEALAGLEYFVTHWCTDNDDEPGKLRCDQCQFYDNRICKVKNFVNAHAHECIGFDLHKFGSTPMFCDTCSYYDPYQHCRRGYCTCLGAEMTHDNICALYVRKLRK